MPLSHMIAKLHCCHALLYYHNCQRQIYDHILFYQNEMFFKFLFLEDKIGTSYDPIAYHNNVNAMN
jgi:hypothetical protein